MKLQVGVKAIIRNGSNEILFLQRSNAVFTDSSQKSWDIPGGRIDPGEPLLDALCREIQEEIGWTLRSDAQLIAAQDIIIPEKELHVVRLTYVIDTEVSEIVLSDEHSDYRWASIEATDSMNIEPYLAQVLKNLK